MPQHSLLQSAISSHQERIVGLQERNGAHQNRTENYKFMRLSLLLFREKKHSVYTKMFSFIKLLLRSALGIMNGRNETRGSHACVLTL